MDIERYLERRRKLEAAQPQYRKLCLTCRQPQFACYCSLVRPVETGIQFVILTHHIEVKRRIATGRMAHLCLQRSLLIQGEDYSHDRRVNAVIEDSANHCMILYPKGKTVNVSDTDVGNRGQLFPRDKNLVLFVIDGTWNTARKTMHRSQNLKTLPRICFTPPGPSHFRVRVQPAANFYSTLEAIHHTINLLGADRGFDASTGQHDHLLDLFHRLVDQQLELKDEAHKNPLVTTGRMKKKYLRAKL